jgi:hypothetical protein
MESVTISDEIPISLNSLKKYLSSNFQIEININEDLVKNIIGNNSNYKIIKKGKSKNTIKINKKRKHRIENKNIIIKKEDYINKNDKNIITKNIELHTISGPIKKEYKLHNNINKCNKCTSSILKYAVERILNIKYSSDIKKIYNEFTFTNYNYYLIHKSFNNLIHGYINICNFVKCIKLQLDNVYIELCKYRKENCDININIIEYEILLKKLSKIIPTNDFIKTLH